MLIFRRRQGHLMGAMVLKSMAAVQASRISLVAALAAAAALMASVLGAAPASATVICASPDLPPGCGVYRTPADIHAAFANPDPAIIEVLLKDVSHERFLNVVITPLGPDELEEFDSTLSGLVDVTFTSGAVVTDTPLLLVGPVAVLTMGKTGNTTGTFQTEIVAMSLTGNILGSPVEIRESPTEPSLGLTTITDIGGGQYTIDSFFDIWVEVSVNGGPFVPLAGDPPRVTLVGVCGDGILDPGEECDDSNNANGDGCSADCVIEEVCGNGIVGFSEECDDGNTTSFDGCSSFCEIEGELIPTLPPWSLLMLTGMLLGTSCWLIRRRLGERG